MLWSATCTTRVAVNGGNLVQILAEVEDSPKAAAMRAQLVLLWSGPVIAVVLIALFVAFPGFFPPHVAANVGRTGRPVL